MHQDDTVVDHKLFDTKATTLSQQINYMCLYSSFGHPSCCFVLNYLERLQKILLSAPQQAYLKNQFTTENSICHHEPGLKTCNFTEHSQSIYPGVKLLNERLIIILDVFRPLKVILDENAQQFLILDWLNYLCPGVDLNLHVE